MHRSRRWVLRPPDREPRESPLHMLAGDVSSRREAAMGTATINRAEPLEEQLVDWITDFKPDEELRTTILAASVVGAGLTAAGLFYAYNVRGTSAKGRAVFEPTSDLLRCF
jgi:hypothetical protein